MSYPIIKEIADEEELIKSVDIIRKSFATVANDFGLTEENCPTNPAFIKVEKLREQKHNNILMFGLYDNDSQIGFVAIEKADDDTYYMEKLSVLPEYRCKGYGKKLMEFVFAYVGNKKGKKVTIGIINENINLKNWYKKCGFTETGTKKFAHLPFTVCFLEKQITAIETKK